MKYIIQSKKIYERKDVSLNEHIGYFQGVGGFIPFPVFGNIDGAKRFNSKKEALKQLQEIGRKENDRYKIIKDN